MRLTLILTMLTAVLAVPASAAAAAGPDASAARTCSLTLRESRGIGPTYVTKLTAVGTSCTTAKSFARAYYRCRVNRGGRKGTCPRLRGYRCTERRNRSPVSFVATSTCRSGGKRIGQVYTQNTV